MRNRRPFRTAATAAAILAIAATSCAYFNTLYNARKIYGEAEEMREERGGEPDRSLDQKYDEVITKCAKVIRDYPDSRWVDDAIFLMGQALVRKGEYDKGIRKFVELTTNFPESGHVPASLYWLAQANIGKGDYNQALVYTDRFLKAFPKNDLRFEVMFLAGDISTALGENETALGYYSKVAEESGGGERKDQAIRRSADLYLQLKDWENAATSYEMILRKGMKWSEKYDVTLSLADCYTETGRCQEGLDLYRELLKEVTTTKEKPPLQLGKARSYVCMDSLASAISEYKRVTKAYPKSNYSAEAYFQLGVIYHEKMDSLSLAQEAYSKVSNESASSEYASISLQRAGSLKRLMELQEGEGGGLESLAEKRFLAAEIQLTRLGETEQALANYQSVVDSFPGSDYAPAAAYAVGWIYSVEKGDSSKAIEAFSRLVREFPVSPQAKGAVDEIARLGYPELRDHLAAFVDSAATETARIAAEMDSIRMLESRSEVDSSAAVNEPDSSAAAVEQIQADSLSSSPVLSPPETVPAPDSTAAVKPSGGVVDTTKTKAVVPVRRKRS